MRSSGLSSLGRFKVSQTNAIIFGVAALSFGMSIWQLSVPGFLGLYDSGVYFTASFHLVTGILPYRDFTFVQPPGILLLISPITLLTRVIGSHDGYTVARVVSAFVTALNAALLARLVRYRGRVAMLIAGVGLALIPVASYVSTGLRLEPYLICFILLGSLRVIASKERGELTNRQLIIGGLLFGVAASIKLWAFFPFVALVITLLPSCRRRVLAFVGAAATGFVVLCLPFFLLAPKNFVSQVFVEQLTRRAIVTNDGGVVSRLIDMTGYLGTSIAPSSTEVVIAFVVLLMIVVLAYARRIEHESPDLYLLLAAIASMGGLLAGPDSYPYYGYFTAPFILGVLGVSVVRLGAPIRSLVQTARAPVSIRRVGSGLVATGAAAIVVLLLLESASFYSSEAREYGYDGYEFAAITNLIPTGSCVVYDQASYGMLANRLQSSDPNCPSLVDPVGMWMAWGYELVPPKAAFVAQWKSYFEEAQYVVLSAPNASGVAWNPSLMTWFNDNYYQIFGSNGVYIYENKS